MTITVEVKPEVQSELSRRAAAHAVDVGSYVAGLLEKATHVPCESNPFGSEKLDKTLREMAQFSSKIPNLSDEALTREHLYSNHDCWSKVKAIF